MKINKVGVLGCGLMGSGIAQVCSQSGYAVKVLEMNEDLLKKGIASIDKFLSKSIEKGKISTSDKDSILSKIHGTTNIQDFSDCDLVIEAIPEKMSLKKDAFAKLDKICPEHTIISTNTSALSITEISSATNRPDKIAGLHFFNPVPLMKLLEIVKTIATSESTLNTCKEFALSLGKTAVIAKDTPGFIVNRLLFAFQINAVRMLESGVATKEDIDTAVKLGLNHPMGPIELVDLLGLDTGQSMAETMYEAFKEIQYAPPVIWKQMVNIGWYGRKTGKGFYEYK